MPATLLRIASLQTGDAKESPSSSGAISFVDNPRTIQGRYLLRCNPSGSGLAYYAVYAVGTTGRTNADFNVTQAFTSPIVRVDAATGSNSEPIITYRNSAGTHTLGIRINSARKIEVWNLNSTALVETSANALTLGSYYRIDVKGTKGLSGAYEVKVTLLPFGTASVWCTGTCSQSASNIASIVFGKLNNRNSQGYDIYFDTLVVCSGDYLPAGDFVAGYMAITGNGSDVDGWATAPVSGQPLHEQIRDWNTGPDDGASTMINNSAASPASDCIFTLQSTNAARIIGPTIYAVQAMTQSKGTSPKSGIVLVSNGSRETSGNTAATADFSETAILREGDNGNGGAAWTRAYLDALQVGPYTDDTILYQFVCTAVGLVVLFAPSPLGIATLTGRGTAACSAKVAARGAATATGKGLVQGSARVAARGSINATGRALATLSARVAARAAALATGIGTAALAAAVLAAPGTAIATGVGTAAASAHVAAEATASATGIGYATCGSLVAAPSLFGTATGRGFASCSAFVSAALPMALHSGTRSVRAFDSGTRSAPWSHQATVSCMTDSRTRGPRRINDDE